MKSEELATLLSSRTARGIAVETSGLIRSGALPLGMRLPTVRDLSFHLGVSPATLSEAWRELRRQKMITGRGRNGAWVSGNTVAPHRTRMASVGHFQEDVLNLALAIPDPAFLPPLARALAHGASAENVNSYERTPILGELRGAVERTWPCEPEAFLATNGGYNAVYAVLHALVMPGASIAIEEPTGMRLLDIIEDLGAEIIPVPRDEEGPVPQSLAEVLARRPTVFLYQPRTHSVTGLSVSSRRMKEMAAILDGTDTLILEDDGVGDVSTREPVSLGRIFPDRVIHIRSFSKSHGPDLRLAVLSASREIVRQIQSYRSFSAGWTSRLLQGAAAWLLNDRETDELLVRARAAYASRRAEFVAALSDRGIVLPPGDGLCVWMPVESEQFALVTLAARGIAVLPGEKCAVRPVNHLRVATSLLAEGHDAVADAMALAAGSPPETDR